MVALTDDVRILARASWQPGPRVARPAVVLVHGLGGSDGASYMLATGRLAWRLGWHVIRMNLRGAGDSEALCPRLYNAGLEGDVVGVLADTAREAAWIGVVGFSLGASVSLLAFAQEARLPPAVGGLVAVSAPLDLARCAGALERPENRLYQDYFMLMLRRAYRRLRERRPDLYEMGRERGARTVLQYDEAITAPYGGYSSAAQYYASCSAGPRLTSIERPTLLLSAWDDPMVPGDSIDHWPLPGSATVSREILPTGGHVGFVAPTAAPGHFWAAERAMAFLTAKAGDWAIAT